MPLHSAESLRLSGWSNELFSARLKPRRKTREAFEGKAKPFRTGWAAKPPSRRLLTRKISVLTTLPLQSAAG